LIRKSYTPTPAEERANVITHGLGALLAVAGTVLLALKGADGRSAAEAASMLVFGISLIVLYLASTLYHRAPVGPAKRTLRRFDHSAIFLLIAGTYTPFGVMVLSRQAAVVILSVEWGLALAGIILAVFFRRHGPAWQQVAFVILYLGMGWMILPAIGDVSRILGSDALWWTVAGGVSYTAGVLFFSLKRVLFAHAIWHLFVLGGSAAHFITVYRYL